jgi:hypothetical protein
MLLIGVLFAGLLHSEWRILGRVAAQAPANDRLSDLEKLSSDLEADRLAAVKYGEQLGSAELKERRDAAYALAKLGLPRFPRSTLWSKPSKIEMNKFGCSRRWLSPELVLPLSLRSKR